ncbi:MAG: hypothetical protein BWX86_02284 [Verrucomicrobia bacterium ADurb.Bin122]|nr:MAG: hypothetical protein BWX86_02284 [Verrucomicrobia bacterium ADurb.Bin122]
MYASLEVLGGAAGADVQTGDSGELGVEDDGPFEFEEVAAEANRSVLEDEVEKRLLAAQTFGFEALVGDVALDGDVAGDLAIGVAERGAVDVDPVAASILGVVEHLDLEAAALGDANVHAVDGARGGVGPLEERAGFPSFDLLAGVAGELGEARVDPYDGALRIGDDDGLVDVGGDAAELFDFGKEVGVGGMA